MTYEAASNRYESSTYRFTGSSGLQLPPLSLGLWQNFGTDRPEETQRAILRRAFDRGVTHFEDRIVGFTSFPQAVDWKTQNFGVFLQASLKLGPYSVLDVH